MLDEYQLLAGRTNAPYTSALHATTTLGFGLAGEAGEVLDLLKKSIGHGHALDHDKLKKELGDVLWYLASLSAHYGLSLNDVAQANIDKLKARYPDGFSTERSQKRDE
jgi:NTP pyrophosphatase (non-canonical NTP hydrolase)